MREITTAVLQRVLRCTHLDFEPGVLGEFCDLITTQGVEIKIVGVPSMPFEIHDELHSSEAVHPAIIFVACNFPVVAHRKECRTVID